jgi:hypothetical protein
MSILGHINVNATACRSIIANLKLSLTSTLRCGVQHHVRVHQSHRHCTSHSIRSARQFGVKKWSDFRSPLIDAVDGHLCRWTLPIDGNGRREEPQTACGLSQPTSLITLYGDCLFLLLLLQLVPVHSANSANMVRAKDVLHYGLRPHELRSIIQWYGAAA